MARSFSAGDAKQVIREHEQMLRFLQNSENERNKAVFEAERTLSGLINRDGLAALIRTEMKTNAPAQPNWETERFLTNICAISRRAAVAQAARPMLLSYESQITAALSDAGTCGSGLRWMFSSNEKKSRAEQAYQFLNSLLESDYGATVRQMQSDCDALSGLTPQAAAAEIAANRPRYRSALQKSAPNLFKNGKLIRDFDVLLQRVNQISASLQNASQAVEQSRGAIRAAAAGIQSEQAESILGDVPVEEINRGKEKIRTKSLRDAGFNTMLDVYRASVPQLTAVSGISADGAARIKAMAGGFLAQSASASHIRLSADNRTPASTALVSAIYLYRAKQEGIKEFEQLRSDYGEDIKIASRNLENVGNGVVWLLYDNGEKERVIESYSYLGRLVQGEYAQTAARVSALLTGQQTVDPNAAWNDFQANAIAYTNILEELAPSAIGNDDSVYGLPEELAQAIAAQEIDTTGLSCTLRPYQEWGVKYILHQGRTLLGDEMGLGKTVQAIASIVSLRNGGATHFMVVCPASVLSNWCREVEKHSDLTVIKIHGGDRDSSFAKWKEKGGVGVTTFETTAHLPLDEGFRFAMMVVDEAHYIKNPGAMRTKNVRALCEHAEKILFMTGTALENKVEEMLELVKVLRAELAPDVSKMAFMSSAPQFRDAVAPVYYRRKRADVLKELPELTQSEEWCRMSAAERQEYEKTVLSGNYAGVRRVSWNVPDIADSSKANRLREIVAEAESEDRKVIVFSFFLDTISKVAAMFGDKCIGPINGSIPPQRRQELIDEFDKAEAGSVLAAQIQSGGTGLNIQSASVVVLCEPQFKPSIENQAISRAYRMGQSRNVLVYRLLCENTADEKIMKLLEQKQAVFDAFADDSAVADETFELDEKGFGQIVSEEAQRIRQEQQASGESQQPEN